MDTPSVTLSNPVTPEDLDTVRALFQEYADSLEIDLHFQGFLAELDALPHPYVAPRGALLVARVDQLSRNDDLLQRTIEGRLTWCKTGLDQYRS